MILIVGLIFILYSENFKNSLLSFRNLGFGKGDSLLNVALFESDSLLKNDILFIKEILTRYRSSDEVKRLAEYYLRFYFAYTIKSQSPEKSEGNTSDFLNYLKLLDNLSQKDVGFQTCKKLLDTMSDTLLLFHGAFLMAKRFKSYNKDECINLLNELIKNYPQTPYSEIASGYLRVIKSD